MDVILEMEITRTDKIRENTNITVAANKDIAAGGFVDSMAATGQTDSLAECYQPSAEGLAALQSAKQQLKTLQEQKKENPFKDQTKALKIALKIMRGKIVPPQDEQFLIKYDSNLYQMAKNIAMLKERTEKVKSELDDDETKHRQLEELSENNSTDKVLSDDGPCCDPEAAAET